MKEEESAKGLPLPGAVLWIHSLSFFSLVIHGWMEVSRDGQKEEIRGQKVRLTGGQTARDTFLPHLPKIPPGTKKKKKSERGREKKEHSQEYGEKLRREAVVLFCARHNTNSSSNNQSRCGLELDKPTRTTATAIDRTKLFILS